MNSMLDIIQSVIIAGLIAVLVFGIHIMTMRTGQENRVIQQMQGKADAAIALLQEEIKTARQSISISADKDSLSFVNTSSEVVTIWREERALKISRNDGINEPVEQSFVYDLEELEFNLSGSDVIRVEVRIQNRPEDLYEGSNSDLYVTGKKDLFLRNMRIADLQSQ
jgi:hypothetical protein